MPYCSAPASSLGLLTSWFPVGSFIVARKKDHMFFTKKISLSVLVTVSSLMLSACGGAPSEADMKTAINRETEAGIKTMEGFGGKAGADMARSMYPELQSLHKIGCKEDGEKAYRCDVEVEVKQNNSLQKNTAAIRFVKGSDGWLMTK